MAEPSAHTGTKPAAVLRRLSNRLDLPPLAVAALGAASALILSAALRWPPVTFGDSGEYFLMAESLANHGTPDARARDMRSLADHAIGHGLGGSFGRLLGAYRPSREGRLYAIHFFAYPALSVPVKLTLRVLGLNELRAFQVVNAAFFLAALWWVAASGGTAPEERLAWAGLTLFSPALWFVLFPHPEVFSFSLVTIAVVLSRQGRWTAATLCAALASVQNAPLVLLTGVLWLRTVAGARSGQRARAAAGASLAAAPALWPFAFYLWHFGRPSLLAGEAAGIEFVSFPKAAGLLLDLNLGLLPYMPLTVAIAVAGSAWRLARRPRGRLLAAWALLLVMGLACSATGNWNHGTSGPSRYAVWLTPLVLRIALDVLGLGAGARRWAVALCGAAIVAQAAVVFARGGLAGRDDSGEHSYLARWVLECRPSLYKPPAEVFAARTLRVGGGEGPFVYATGGRCRKALAQKRHAELLRELCGHEPPAFTRFQQSIAREGRGRDAWTYVDY